MILDPYYTSHQDNDLIGSYRCLGPILELPDLPKPQKPDQLNVRNSEIQPKIPKK